GSLMGMFHTLQTQHPTQFLSYMTAITTDATLYADQYYAGALPPKLQPIVNAYGVKSRVTAFFDSWSGAHAELTSVNSTNALLQVKYNESPLTYVNALDDAAGDATVDDAIAAIPGLSFTAYVNNIIAVTNINPNVALQNVLQKDSYYLAEHDLYGSSRIGIKQYYPSQLNATYDYTTSPATVDTLRLFNTVPWYSLEYQDDIIAGDVDLYGHALLATYGTQHQAGQRQYEITDHLGDVLATLSDKRRGIDPGHTGNITNYVPSPVALYDYYPFGMLMPGRYVYDTANHCELVTETAPVLTTSSLGWPFLGNWCRPCGFTAVAGGIITFGGSSMTTSSTAAGDGSSLDVSTVSGTAYSGSITTSGMTGGSWTATAMDITSSTILAATTIAQPQTAALNFTAIGPSTRITLTATAASSTFTITAIPFNFTTWTAGTIVTTVCSKDGDAYRYGFNGKLKDNEWSGIGNHLDFGARLYDSRIGRPITIDPLTYKFPMLTPYQFFSDNPIRDVDLDGEEGTPSQFTTNGRVIQAQQHAWVSTPSAEMIKHMNAAEKQNRYAPINEGSGVKPYLSVSGESHGLKLGVKTNGEASVSSNNMTLTQSVKKDEETNTVPDHSGAKVVGTYNATGGLSEVFDPFIATSVVVNDRVEYRDISFDGGKSISKGVPFHTYELIAKQTFAGVTSERRIVYEANGNVLDDSYRKGVKVEGEKGHVGAGVEVTGDWQKTPDNMKNYKDNNISGAIQNATIQQGN
ncbi:MAG: hypothetical protein ACTHJ0_08855, partial [Flavipsychrobacter sp.]